MMLEGKHHCVFCGNYFEWFYQVPQRLGGRLDVETIPKDKTSLYTVSKTLEKDGYKLPLEATAYCPKCNKLNNILIKHEN